MVDAIKLGRMEAFIAFDTADQPANRFLSPTLNPCT